MLEGVTDPTEQERLLKAFRENTLDRYHQQAIVNALSGKKSKSPPSSKTIRLSASHDRIDPNQSPEKSLQKLQQRQVRIVLWPIIDGLKPQQKQVLTHRYGLNAHTPKTLQETGDRLVDADGNPKTVQKERVRHIQGRAEQKFRDPQRSKIVKPLLDTFD